MTHKKEQQIKIEGEFKPTVDCLCATRRRFVFIHKGIDATLAMELLKISFRQPEVVLALAKMVHDVHERSNVQNPLE